MSIIEDACGGSSPHPQTTRPSDLRVLRDHLYLPEARQVEVKARIITMTFAVNSSCWTKRMLQQMQNSMKKVTQKSCLFCDLVMILGVQGPPRGSFEDSAKQDTKTSAVSVHSGRLFWSILGPKSDFCAFCLCQFLCLFLASLLGGLRSQF